MRGSKLPLRIAVLGAGAFGKNHLRIYRELAADGQVEIAAVVDASAEIRAAQPAGTATFSSIEELASALSTGRVRVDAASVCLPTRLHAEATLALLAAGVHVLVEKPIAATLAEARQMTAAAHAARCVLQVGHLERFNPAVAAAFAALRGPMFFEVHRLSIFTPRSLDVDVVLDLMIHDLDILLRMAASPVTEVRAVGLPVLSGKTDIANVRLEFASGCVANLTASRVSTEQVRKLRFFQPHQYISVDYARQEAFSINVDRAAIASAIAESANSRVAEERRGPASAGPLEDSDRAGLQPLREMGQPSQPLAFQPFQIIRAEPLRLEIESFLNAVRNGTPPAVTAEEATAALEIAFRISEQILEHRARTGLA